MRGVVAALLLLALAACAAGSGERGVSGAYVGGAVGGNLREDARPR